MEQSEAIQDSATATEAPQDAPELELDASLLDADLSDVVSDEEEIEHEGEKFKVPKKLKDAFLRQDDYTRKTQAVAEQRKAIEQEREALTNLQKVQHEYLQEVATVTAIDQRLAEFRQINWQELMDKDPVQAMKLDRAMRDLQGQRFNLVGQINQKQAKALNEQQQQAAKLVQEGEAVLASEIKGWSPELKGKLAAYGKDLGATNQELDQVTRPWMVKALHKSFMYDQLVRKQQNKPAPQEANVVTKVGASSGSVTKSPEKMTDAEFAAWRRRQIAQRR